MIGIDLMAHLSNDYVNNFSPMKIMGSLNVGKFTRPEENSFLAITLQGRCGGHLLKNENHLFTHPNQINLIQPKEN
jgi:hypothetical protein